MPYGLRVSAWAFGLAVPVHFIWEMRQGYTFTGMPREVWAATAACAFASLGDGLLTLLILGDGAAAFRFWAWFDRRLPGRWALVGIISFGVAVVTERLLVYELRRWGYAPSMPLIPGAPRRAAAGTPDGAAHSAGPLVGKPAPRKVVPQIMNWTRRIGDGWESEIRCGC